MQITLDGNALPCIMKAYKQGKASKMLKFTKTLDGQTATKANGQVISINRLDPEQYDGMKWGVYYSDDFYGDNTAHYMTLKEAKAVENRIEGE